MTRLIGLDVGDVRTGIAVSDELGLTARPLETVPTGQLATRLTELAGEFEVLEVIVGRPRHLDGSLGEQAAAIEQIVEQLRPQVPATFIYEDETGTTLAGGDDAGAACVMLQGYLAEPR